MSSTFAGAPEGPTIYPDPPSAKIPASTLRAVVAELRAICGDRWVYTHEHQLRTYESDGLLQYEVLPVAAVLPGNAAEVQAVVATCARARVPWVARGAGSGLSGGALPVEDGVLIVLSRMTRILEIDLENGRICVEPGVTNAAVSAAVGPAFFYPPDPSSQIVCSIGGNVAENSGGAHCFKYGFTTNYVTGLEIVLADGEMIRLGGFELDGPGYDLMGVFIGSEGTLGVATKIWLRVVPTPEAIKTLVAFFDTTRQAGEAVSDIVQGGVVPGAIEIMDAMAITAAEQAAHAGFPIGRGAALLVELDGSERECEAHFAEIAGICRRRGSDDVRVARDAAERARFWKARKSAFAAMGRMRSAWDVFVWYGGMLRMGQLLNDTGSTRVLAENVAGVFVGIPWQVVLVAILIIFFYTHYFFASITAHMLAMFPPFIAVLIGIGVPPLLAVYSLLCLANLTAGLTHYGTTTGPILFGTGYVTRTEWWRVGFYVSVANMIIWLTAGFTWWKFLGFW